VLKTLETLGEKLDVDLVEEVRMKTDGRDAGFHQIPAK
jgi:hypothetical protein